LAVGQPGALYVFFRVEQNSEQLAQVTTYPTVPTLSKLHSSNPTNERRNLMSHTAKILRLKRLKEKMDMSGSSIYNKLNPRSKYYDEAFPKPVRLGLGAVGWIESEVDAWLESRTNASRA
jgi:prophage regulatory protein